MKPVLEFYPPRKSTRDLLTLALASGWGAVMFLGLTMFATGDENDLLSRAILGAFGLLCAGFAIIMTRAWLRYKDARPLNQPILIVDSEGIRFSAVGSAAESRLDWLQIDQIMAIDDRTKAIFVTGRFGKFGRQLEIPIDTDEPIDSINSKLRGFAPQ